MGKVVVPYNPFPIHIGFHATKAREKWAAGAVGSGKTIALCGGALEFGLAKQPGSRIMISRATVPALRDSTEAEFVSLISTPPEEDEWFNEDNPTTLFDLCKVRMGGGHIDRLYTPNGTEFLFRSLDNWRKLMSYNLAYIGIDEASELPDSETYLALLTRLRQRFPTPAARRMRLRWNHTPIQQMTVVSNPNGHDWLWELFVNSPTTDRRYFTSTSFDNPTLYEPDGEPSAYLKSLLTMPPVWVERFVFCSFDAFEGQIYDFSYDRHVEKVHFTPPDNWDRGLGMDWGIRNPTALGWWARDPDSGIWYKYREWQSYDPTDPIARSTATSPTVAYVASVIKRLEGGERIKWRAAGPDVWRRQTGNMDHKTIEQHFATHGIYFTPGAPDYSSRINAVNTLLAHDKIRISPECPMTQVAYQQYRWKDLKVNRTDDQPEQPRKKDDHLVDADQYLFTLFTNSAPPPTPQAEFSWDNHIRRQIQQQVARHGARRSGIGPE